MIRRVLALAPAVLAEGADWIGTVNAASEVACRHGAALTVVLLGGDAAALGPIAVAGADEVHVVDHPALAPDVDGDVLAAIAADALERIGLADAPLVLTPTGVAGDTLAATLAVRLDGTVLGLCSEILLGGDLVRARRASHGGRAVTTATVDGLCFAALRPPKAAPPRAGRGVVHRLALDTPVTTRLDLRRRDAGVKIPAVEGARVVVSGGRGIGGEAGFAQLGELADCLGGALGGSLPTIDAGWLPVFRQIGQTGKYVTPEVYVAVAISGTPQHMAGIGPDTRIVAVNSDAEADIFRYAEIGVVADWTEVVPELVARLRRA